MLTYVIISGIIMAVWFTYKDIKNSNEVSLLDIILNTAGGLVTGWLMLPVAFLSRLDDIKLKK